MAKIRDWFRADVTLAGREGVRIDHEKNIIKGFRVVTKGVTKDERGEFDDAALDTVVEFGNRTKAGVKSRFGHPNMSGEALGTYLGRVKGFRRDGDTVRADLHVDKTAFNTPDGNLGKYVLELAESAPEMFGASMVIEWDAVEHEEKEDIPPVIALKKLLSVDVVDDPAANSGFFSRGVRPSVEMTEFLDRFLSRQDAVERVIGFLNRYSVNKENFNSSGEIKEAGRMEIESVTINEIREKRADIYDEIINEGFSRGVKEERARAVSVLKKAQEFEGMNELAYEAIENALSAEKAEISFQKKRLFDIESGSAPRVGPDTEIEPAGKLSHLERARAYKEEHGCSMTRALQITAEKRE